MSWERIKLFRWNKKHFSSFLNSCQKLSQNWFLHFCWCNQLFGYRVVIFWFFGLWHIAFNKVIFWLNVHINFILVSRFKTNFVYKASSRASDFDQYLKVGTRKWVCVKSNHLLIASMKNRIFGSDVILCKSITKRKMSSVALDTPVVRPKLYSYIYSKLWKQTLFFGVL